MNEFRHHLKWSLKLLVNEEVLGGRWMMKRVRSDRQREDTFFRLNGRVQPVRRCCRYDNNGCQ